MKYSLYPGCAGEATTKEALVSTKAILDFLKVDYTENPAYSCCGAGIVEEEDPEFEMMINVRNFAMAEKEGRDIITICNTCLLTMLKAKKKLEDNPGFLKQVNEDLSKLGLEYKGSLKIRHFLWFLRDDIGLEKLGELKKIDLKGVKMAPFYGCHIMKPNDILMDSKEPEFLSEVINLCGATAVAYEEKYNCCGFHILLADEKTSLKMTDKCLTTAVDAGAEILVTPCTLCHISLDCYQGKAASRNHDLPVLHLSQLIGLSFGLGFNSLGLDTHLISVEKYFKPKEV